MNPQSMRPAVRRPPKGAPTKPLIYLGILLVASHIWLANSGRGPLPLIPRNSPVYIPLMNYRNLLRNAIGVKPSSQGLTFGDCALVRARGEQSSRCDQLLKLHEKKEREKLNAK